MSLMSRVIIIGSTLEGQKQKNKINEWLEKNNHLPIKEINENYENKWLGGEKVFTSFLLVGCFNYLDVDEFIKILTNLKWEYPEMIRILIENDSKWIDEGYQLFKLKKSETIK